MKRTLPTLMLLTATSFAAVPVSFSSGTPAKADDVNKNFASLDSAIQKKAEASLVSVLQTAVSAKADLSKEQSDSLTLAKAIATKANQIDLNTKKDSAWIVSAINGKLPTGTLSAASNLKDLADPAAARTNLGLGAISTKASLTANDVGALDQATADLRYLGLGGGSLSGPLFLKSSSPLRDSAGSWLFGYGPSSIGIGSAASSNRVPITIWNGSSDGGVTLDTTATFGKDYISFRRSVAISTSAPLSFIASGSGIYDRTTLYVFPKGAASVKGFYLELPRLSDAHSALPSDFELNVRGGDLPIIKYDGTNDLFSMYRPTKINDLTIGGSLKTASGMIKSSDVADYVFEPDYKLASLSDVEAYTKEHKHLPEVPSAAEIEQGGMDLAKMNLLLLKKVEELTLHTIELEKRLKAVEATQKP